MDGDEQEVESRAREWGWVPKEDFKGNPDLWKDASEYVARGEELLPVLKANDRKLRAELSSLKNKTAQQDREQAEMRESLKSLKEFNKEMATREVKEKKAVLKGQIKAAREENDVDAELELQEQFSSLKEPEEEPEQEPTPPASGKTEPKIDPAQAKVLKEWGKENPWFGADRKKTAMANAIADEIRADPEHEGIQGREFLDLVAEKTAEFFDGPARSKVESGRGPGNGGGGGGSNKGYSQLPSDAKAQCDKDEKKFVGANKAFKTKEEWRKHFVSQYER